MPNPATAITTPSPREVVRGLVCSWREPGTRSRVSEPVNST